MATITKKLVSSFARFVQGDIKGGDAAHAYRKEIIATAIEQAYKGNYEPINEAKTLTEGKAKKSRAYAAGFAALGTIGDADGIKKVHYVGSLNANENKSAREEIANKTAASVSAFFGAFDVVMAEKAEKKEKKAETVAADVAPASGAPTSDELRHAAAVSLDDSVTHMETLIRTGALTGEQVDRLAFTAVEVMPLQQLRDLAAAIQLAETAALLALAAQSEPVAA